MPSPPPPWPALLRQQAREREDTEREVLAADSAELRWAPRAARMLNSPPDLLDEVAAWARHPMTLGLIREQPDDQAWVDALRRQADAPWHQNEQMGHCRIGESFVQRYCGDSKTTRLSHGQLSIRLSVSGRRLVVAYGDHHRVLDWFWVFEGSDFVVLVEVGPGAHVQRYLRTSDNERLSNAVFGILADLGAKPWTHAPLETEDSPQVREAGALLQRAHVIDPRAHAALMCPGAADRAEALDRVEAMWFKRRSSDPSAEAKSRALIATIAACAPERGIDFQAYAAEARALLNLP